jgi:hypothetical protein
MRFETNRIAKIAAQKTAINNNPRPRAAPVSIQGRLTAGEATGLGATDSLIGSDVGGTTPAGMGGKDG